MSPRQALIFGASGISGWAIVREALQHKDPTDRNSQTKPTFDRVIALSRSPLDESEFLLAKDVTNKRLVLHSGIDLGQAEDAHSLFKNIEGIEKTTHVYYAGELLLAHLSSSKLKSSTHYQPQRTKHLPNQLTAAMAPTFPL
jgi:hypothetical protein